MLESLFGGLRLVRAGRRRILDRPAETGRLKTRGPRLDTTDNTAQPSILAASVMSHSGGGIITILGCYQSYSVNVYPSFFKDLIFIQQDELLVDHCAYSFKSFLVDAFN